MPRYAYAICYCSQTRKMLVFKKNRIAYFYGNIVDDKGVRTKLDYVSDHGMAVKHGPGSYCFPGGGVKARERPSVAAAREFCEETGVSIANYVPVLRELLYKENTVYGVFYNFSPTGYNTLFLKVQESLNAKESAIRKMKNPPYSDCSFNDDFDGQIIRALRFLNTTIQDDELEAVYNIEIKDYSSYFKRNDLNTGWFFEFVNLYLSMYLNLVL